ncbi:MAG TPA: class I SAM-dependent methyltransferase [Polyangiaceae bacterium]|nr:class I SAM-dependent methyltransferase [Polyangiaceae bacterium]
MIPAPISALLKNPMLARTFRTSADWIDLEWWQLNDSLLHAAQFARGALLDVGCGDKPHEHIFRPYIDSYVGVEYGETFSNTKASTHDRKADFLYDGLTLPFEDQSFDTVLSVQVLEHTPNAFEVFAEMARVLRDKGTLILTVPFSGRLHEEPHDYLRFTPHMMRELCARNGLKVKEIRPRGGFWSVLGHKVNSYLGFRVLRMGGLVQALGKVSQEAPITATPRLWTLPVVAPAMVAIAGSARVLDKTLPDPTEMLGFLLIAERDLSASTR